MRWRVETFEEWRLRLTTPHRWFAWHPVTTSDGYRVWLEHVERVAEEWSLADNEGGPLFSYRLIT